MRRLPALAVTLALALSTAGCELIVDILQVGFWMGVILVLIVVGLIWWIARLVTGRRNDTRTPPE